MKSLFTNTSQPLSPLLHPIVVVAAAGYQPTRLSQATIMSQK